MGRGRAIIRAAALTGAFVALTGALFEGRLARVSGFRRTVSLYLHSGVLTLELAPTSFALAPRHRFYVGNGVARRFGLSGEFSLGWQLPRYWCVFFLRGMDIPLWFPFSACCLAAALTFKRGAGPRPEGRCQSCGYDLRGNVSGRCPECGTPTPKTGAPIGGHNVRPEGERRRA